MKKLIDRLYEHLITKGKYNTLENTLEITEEKLERKIIECDTQKNINKIQLVKFEEAIEDLTQKLVKERQKYRDLKEKKS